MRPSCISALLHAYSVIPCSGVPPHLLCFLGCCQQFARWLLVPFGLWASLFQVSRCHLWQIVEKFPAVRAVQHRTTSSSLCFDLFPAEASLDRWSEALRYSHEGASHVAFWWFGNSVVARDYSARSLSFAIFPIKLLRRRGEFGNRCVVSVLASVGVLRLRIAQQVASETRLAVLLGSTVGLSCFLVRARSWCASPSS